MPRAIGLPKVMLAIVTVVAILGGFGGTAAALTWTLRTVHATATGDFGNISAIAIDSAGLPHIAYRDAFNHDVWYAKRLPSGFWRKELVDNQLEAGWGLSMALDSLGHAHVSYYRGDTPSGGVGDLVYAKRTCFYPPDGICLWSTTVVRPGAHSIYVTDSTSIVVDAAGRPHIVFYDNTQQHLRWAKLEDSGWSLTNVVSAPDGALASLALDPDGFPHIAYTVGSRGTLSYAKVSCIFVLCGWAIETIDTDDLYDLGIGAAGIRLDASHRPHVAYFRSGYTMYATRVCSGSGSTESCAWAPQTVGAAGASVVVSRSPSLALDSGGNPRIAFVREFAAFAGEVLYARRFKGSWLAESVSVWASAAADISLALDAAGDLHLSLNDRGPDALIYAKGTPLVSSPGLPPKTVDP